MLALRTITITFPENDAITCDISLNRGEICAITGPSGVGKSTLLLALAGFHDIASGDMLWQDDSFADKPVWDRPLSLLFQSDNIFGHLSVQRNIALAAPKTAKKPEINAKIEEITSKLAISNILNKMGSEISGGQQQRVGLARALMSDKPILLLDEPFSALDKANRIKALNLVQEITTTHQLTTLIVTHDEDDITHLDARSLRLQRQSL